MSYEIDGHMGYLPPSTARRVISRARFPWVWGGLLLFGLLAAGALAQNSQSAGSTPPELRSDFPNPYVVRRGDTLWDISARYLVEPWRWPEIWEVNPQVRNPHLIFPGDQLFLTYRDGRPVVSRTRPSVADARRGTDTDPGAGTGTGTATEGTGDGGVLRRTGPRTFKLSPRVRVLPLDRAIPAISIDAIQPFLMRPRVLSQEEIDATPYIVSFGVESLLGAPGKKTFVRRLRDTGQVRYSVFRKGEPYIDPEVGEFLGFEMIHVGDAALDTFGDPATMLLTSSTQEVLVGDRLLPVEDDEFTTNFFPRAPDDELRGLIISVLGGVDQIGQNAIVVLNLGARDGLQPGHVLAVFQQGETIVDTQTGVAPGDRWWRTPVDESRRPEGITALPQAVDDVVVEITDRTGAFVGQFLPSEDDPLTPGSSDRELVKLPDERAGTLIVFRPFERISYALVLKATSNMHVNDVVTNP